TRAEAGLGEVGGEGGVVSAPRRLDRRAPDRPAVARPANAVPGGVRAEVAAAPLVVAAPPLTARGVVGHGRLLGGDHVVVVAVRLGEQQDVLVRLRGAAAAVAEDQPAVVPAASAPRAVAQRPLVRPVSPDAVP